MISLSEFALYIGCPCMIFDNQNDPKCGTPAIIEGCDFVQNKIICERANFDPSVVKPILRPITDMKKEEAIEVLKRIIHRGIDYPETDYGFEVYSNSILISINNDWFKETFRIGTMGSIWTITPSNIKVPTSIHLYLLSRRFDVLGFISRGLALTE